MLNLNFDKNNSRKFQVYLLLKKSKYVSPEDDTVIWKHAVNLKNK